MAGFDRRVARLANLTRSSLARSLDSDLKSPWHEGVRRELRAWLTLGTKLDFFPTDPATLAAIRRIFGEPVDDPFVELFHHPDTNDLDRVHSAFESALLLADYLFADDLACRFLEALAFADQGDWDRLLIEQNQLVASIGERNFDRLGDIASGGTWLLDGTVRLVHHIHAFQGWVELFRAEPAADEATEGRPSVVHAVAALQQWRFNFTDQRTSLRLRRAVTVTTVAGDVVSTIDESLDAILWYQWLDRFKVTHDLRTHQIDFSWFTGV